MGGTSSKDEIEGGIVVHGTTNSSSTTSSNHDNNNNHNNNNNSNHNYDYEYEDEANSLIEQEHSNNDKKKHNGFGPLHITTIPFIQNNNNNNNNNNKRSNNNNNNDSHQIITSTMIRRETDDNIYDQYRDEMQQMHYDNINNNNNNNHYNVITPNSNYHNNNINNNTSTLGMNSTIQQTSDGQAVSLVKGDLEYKKGKSARHVVAVATTTNNKTNNKRTSLSFNPLAAAVGGSWKSGHVILNLLDGGSIRCFPPTTTTTTSTTTTQQQQQQYSRQDYSTNNENDVNVQTLEKQYQNDRKEELQRQMESPELEIPSFVPYTVKDIKNDSYRFVIEIIHLSSNITDDTTTTTNASTANGSSIRKSSMRDKDKNNKKKKNKTIKKEEQVTGTTTTTTTTQTKKQSKKLHVSFSNIDLYHDLNQQQQQQQEERQQEQPPVDFTGFSQRSNNDNNPTYSQRRRRSDQTNDATTTTAVVSEDLHRSWEKSIQQGKPLRIYFRCSQQHEKILWLSAFDRLGRLRKELRHNKGWGAIANIPSSLIFARTRRKRGPVGEQFIQNCRLLMMEEGGGGEASSSASASSSPSHRPHKNNDDSDDEWHSTKSDDNGSVIDRDNHHQHPQVHLEEITTKTKRQDSHHHRHHHHNHDIEFLVLPSYAYPNRWMTEPELIEEMLKPSTTFYDFRKNQSTSSGQLSSDSTDINNNIKINYDNHYARTINNNNDSKKEIGMLKVEVLQCLGLPNLDYVSGSDPVVYLVCGSCAFATDIIWNRQQPIWPCKSRRACIFPLFDGFARLYAGVFDDDGSFGKNDDFAGRVVVDLARCRPRSTYDVTLPLRHSAHVYTTKQLGSIRLRFTVDWHSDRDALLSYIIPNDPNPTFPGPTKTRPNNDLTVICADEKAFRNIAITVHGHHLPGHFSMKHMRATALEVALTQMKVFIWVEELGFDVVFWRKPLMSMMVFGAWMHAATFGRFYLVPAYLFLFLLLFLMNNYFIFLADNTLQNGFTPPTWEEMFWSLFLRSNKIQPIVMPAAANDQELGTIGQAAKTHQPWGLWLYRFICNRRLGGQAIVDPRGEEDEVNRMEFPLSLGLGYPKITVEDQMNGVPRNSTKKARNSIVNSKRGKNYSGKSDDNVTTKSIFSGVWDFDSTVVASARTARNFSASTKRHKRVGFRGTESERVIFGRPGVQIMGQAAETGMHVLEENTKVARKVAVRAAGTGISGVKKTASVVGAVADGAVTMVGLKWVGKKIGKVAIGAGHVVDTGAEKVGLKKVGKAVGGAAGTGIITFGRNTKKAGHFATETASKAVGTVGHAAGAGILRIGKATREVGEAIRRVIIDEEGDDSDSDEGGSIASGDEDGYAFTESRLLYPEQNLDLLRYRKTDAKPLTEEVQSIKNDMHRCTFHIFNDRAYLLRDPNNSYYFNGAKKGDHYQQHHHKPLPSTVQQDLDKLLHLGQYSHANPFLAQLGIYMEPMHSGALSFLALFRSLYNIFTWQDPMLSFWVSILLGIMTTILFFFPWKIAFLLAGIISTGPQNWLLRRLHDKKMLPLYMDSIFPESEEIRLLKRKQRRLEESNQNNNNNNQNEDDSIAMKKRLLPTNQPIIKAPEGDDVPCRILSIHDVDPREVHEVSVPYSRFMYHRFYDWPPEPQYARVEQYDDNFDNGNNL